MAVDTEKQRSLRWREDDEGAKDSIGHGQPQEEDEVFMVESVQLKCENKAFGLGLS